MANPAFLWVTQLRDAGWQVQERSAPHESTPPPALVARYGSLPQDYKTFLSAVTACVAPDRKAWFVCENVVNETSEKSFRWNEWELMSREAAKSFGPAEIAKVVAFWSQHLPVVVSVKSDYSYLAIELATGRIVLGAEPEFEGTVPVCDSFPELVDLIGMHAKGDPTARGVLVPVL